MERFLIELIRVNATYPLFGMNVTQAQIISTACIVAGLVVMGWRRQPPPAASSLAHGHDTARRDHAAGTG